MKTLRFYIPLFLLAMVSCGRPDDKGSTTTKEEKAEPVKVVTLETRTVARTVEYTATLQAFEEIHLAPAAPGRIESIMAEVGDRVKQGQVLVQMDRTQWHQANIQMRTLETDFSRLDTLRKVGSIPLQQYDQLKSQYEIARSNVEFLSENTRLKAPFSGLISGKYFEAGEMYSGAPVPSIGKPAILSIVQINRLKLLVPISEKYFPLVHKGMNVNIVTDIYPENSFRGKVFNLYPTMDPASRTFNIEISVDNPSEKLRPGMFARVSLDLDKVESILLPAIAVLKLQGSNDRYLFVAEEGKARRVSVVVGARYDDMIEVISDELSLGDEVVINGQARLLDGMQVNIVRD
ncbi:MAG: efflux RND transporter periplasmic adaptor subunit [Bacteroidales bacterium]|nr:efflux RND transporter periplasmic adaptor subunit [Bacteroidales bacterium]